MRRRWRGDQSARPRRRADKLGAVPPVQCSPACECTPGMKRANTRAARWRMGEPVSAHLAPIDKRATAGLCASLSTNKLPRTLFGHSDRYAEAARPNRGPARSRVIRSVPAARSRVTVTRRAPRNPSQLARAGASPSPNPGRQLRTTTRQTRVGIPGALAPNPPRPSLSPRRHPGGRGGLAIAFGRTWIGHAVAAASERGPRQR